MSVSIFSKTFVWNISHPKKKWVGYDQKCILVFTQSTRYSCAILKKFENFSTEFRKIFKCKILQKWEELRAVVTPVRNYHYSLRNNPEECSSHLLRGGNPRTFLKIRPVGQPSCSMLTDRWTEIMKLKESLSAILRTRLKTFLSTTLLIQTYLNTIYIYQNVI